MELYKSIHLLCKQCFLILALLSLTETVWAQRISIQAQLDRAEMKTGEQAVINVTIRTDDLEHTKYHLVERTTEPLRFLVLHFGATDTIELGHHLQEIRAKMLITSFDSTLITIPPIMAVNGADTALTEPMALSIIQPDVDLDHPEEIKDIKPLWEVSYSWRDILYLVVTSPILWALLCLVLLGYTIYRIVRSRAQRPKPTLIDSELEQEEALSPIEIFEERIVGLERRHYYSREDYKVMYTELVDALKVYLHQIEGWPLQEMTTSQIVDFIATTDTPLELRRDISALLKEADMSKFAKSEPLDADARASIRHTRAIAQRIEQKHQECFKDSNEREAKS